MTWSVDGLVGIRFNEGFAVLEIPVRRSSPSILDIVFIAVVTMSAEK